MNLGIQESSGRKGVWGGGEGETVHREFWLYTPLSLEPCEHIT